MEIQVDRDDSIDGSVDKPGSLGRTKFVRHLFEIQTIGHSQECFVASLEGPWRYGKS